MSSAAPWLRHQSWGCGYWGIPWGWSKGSTTSPWYWRSSLWWGKRVQGKDAKGKGTNPSTGTAQGEYAKGQAQDNGKGVQGH